LFYVLETGCSWGHLPKDLPPKSTVHDYFDLWSWDGTLERMHDALYVELREAEGREPQPRVAILDSQSAKSAQKEGRESTRSGACAAHMAAISEPMPNTTAAQSPKSRPWTRAGGSDPRNPVNPRRSSRIVPNARRTEIVRNGVRRERIVGPRKPARCARRGAIHS
jgi:hypothetical protein